ncbi:(2Fe-2S)-binding protein [Streptomyces sp. NBC_00388]|uniref:(2Fe-2S)-binding protein n=1 Tax=Streptomyces sp. NBC_00388 TaxID=2975735 RepID=UPI002E1C7542
MTDISAVLSQLDSVGPYFTVRHGGRPDPEGFRPLSDLYGTDPDATGADAADPVGVGAYGTGAAGTGGLLGAYVGTYARRMGTDQLRVAASTLHLALVSRLWSVAVGAAVLSGCLPDLAPERTRVRLTGDGPLELWLPVPELAPGQPQPGHEAAAVRASVALPHLYPLHAALRARFGVSPHTLRGNAASALVGAVRVLNGRRPGTETRATALAAGVLAGEPLADSGDFIVEEGLGFAFLRNSCCLYYRAPGGSLCGDCVLRHPRRDRPGP